VKSWTCYRVPDQVPRHPRLLPRIPPPQHHCSTFFTPTAYSGAIDITADNHDDEKEMTPPLAHVTRSSLHMTIRNSAASSPTCLHLVNCTF
jgi:hypothetical protein